MLNELSDHVDSTEGRLATARRKLEDFIRKSEGTLSFSPSPPPHLLSVLLALGRIPTSHIGVRGHCEESVSLGQ
jgi:hypothetical protein